MLANWYKKQAVHRCSQMFILVFDSMVTFSFYTSFRNKSLCLILYSWHTLLWFMLCLHRITIYRYKTTITLTAYIIWWFIVNKGKWNEVLGSQIDLLHRICNNELFFFGCLRKPMCVQFNYFHCIFFRTYVSTNRRHN